MLGCNECLCGAPAHRSYRHSPILFDARYGVNDPTSAGFMVRLLHDLWQKCMQSSVSWSRPNLEPAGHGAERETAASARDRPVLRPQPGAIASRKPVSTHSERTMILDAYNTIWNAKGTSDYLTAEDFTADMMLAAMDGAEVDMAVICSLGQLQDDDYIEESHRRYSDRFIPFCQIDPRTASAVEALRRRAAKGMFRGVKLHPTMHGYHFADHGLLDPIFDVCRMAKLTILVNALDDPFCAPLAIEEITSGFPEVPVIIAHMGAVWNVTEAILVAKRRSNIYLETSCAELQSVRDAYRQVGPERILMGTDWPGSDFDLERFKVAKAIPDAQDRELVQGENLARILQLSRCEQ